MHSDKSLFGHSQIGKQGAKGANAPLAVCMAQALLAVFLVGLAPHARADGAQAHDAAVIAARQGRLDEALSTLERLEKTSTEPRIRHDLIVIFGWAGRHPQAVQVWARMGWTTDLPDYVRLGLSSSLKALASESERAGKRLDALRYLGHALRLAPAADTEKTEAAVIRLMGELGGHQGAAWRSPTLGLQQRADAAALRLRLAKHLGDSAGPERKTRLTGLEAELTALISEARKAPLPEPRLLRQLLGDRAVVHVELQQWAQALEDVEATAALGSPLLPYVQMAQGAALLGLQRPSLARPVYEAVLAAQPDNLAARWGLFYAWADQGAFDAATAVMDNTAPERWRRVGWDARTEQDPDWLFARMASARVRSWNQQHAEAWAQLNALRALSPDDAGIRLALSSVAAARGWPRRAEQEARAAQTLDETNPQVQLALAESALRRQQWGELHRRMGASEGVASAQRAQLERDAQLKQGWRLAADHQWRTEPGRLGQQPGAVQSTATRLDAPLVHEGWRPFFKAEHIQGTTPGVFDAVRRRAGLGLQYEGPDDALELLAVQETGSRPGSSFSLNARHAYNDHWTVAAGASNRSADVPLRATANGIDMNTAHLGLDYHRDEAFGGAVRWQSSQFSDGNQRLSGTAALTQQLLASSVWRLSTRQEVYTSRNSSNAGPYFSPLRDALVSLSLISEHVWLRSPQRDWSDRLELQAGRYHQMGYGAQTVSAVSYEHTYSPSPAWSWAGGVTHSLRYYDGVPQRATTGHVRVVTRF